MLDTSTHWLPPPLGLIRWIDLPAATLSVELNPLPTEDEDEDGFKDPFGSFSRFIEPHRPHVKDAVTQLMSSTLRSLGWFSISSAFRSSTVRKNSVSRPTCSALLLLPCSASCSNSQPSIARRLPISRTLLSLSYRVTLTRYPRVLPMPRSGKRTPTSAISITVVVLSEEPRASIVNSFSDLEPHAMNSFSDGRTPPVYPVGPLIDSESRIHIHSPSNRIQRDKIMKWLDDQPASSVVLLCFGSIGCFGAPLVREIAVGLEGSGARFLWYLRQRSGLPMGPPRDYTTNLELGEILPDGFLDRTEGRGLISGGILQVEVLGHPAIGGFISHCGWNSILESLWFGVPVATWPLYAEQHINAFEMVRELGLAMEITLDYRNGDDLVSAEEVERSVRSLKDGDREVWDEGRRAEQQFWTVDLHLLRWVL